MAHKDWFPTVFTLRSVQMKRRTDRWDRALISVHYLSDMKHKIPVSMGGKPWKTPTWRIQYPTDYI